MRRAFSAAQKKAGGGGGKAKKKKWSKGKVKEKLQNLVLFDKATYDKMIADVPKQKLITPSIISEKLKVRGRARARARARARGRGGVGLGLAPSPRQRGLPFTPTLLPRPQPGQRLIGAQGREGAHLQEPDQACADAQLADHLHARHQHVNRAATV